MQMRAEGAVEGWEAVGPGFRGAVDDGAVGFVEGEVGGVPG